MVKLDKNIQQIKVDYAIGWDILQLVLSEY